MVRPLTSRTYASEDRLRGPERPAAYAERRLVTGILRGRYRVGGNLPAERELAEELGVTRPTLREVLKRLDRDGWITVRHGRPTRVNDALREGGLNVLSALVRHGNPLPEAFVAQLLEVRCALAPAYTRAAVARDGAAVARFLAAGEELPEEAGAFARFDWEMHRLLGAASGNPVYTLILNGFAGFYEEMAALYFAREEARASSRAFYRSLAGAARDGDAERAFALAADVMGKSLALWRRLESRDRRRAARKAGTEGGAS